MRKNMFVNVIIKKAFGVYLICFFVILALMLFRPYTSHASYVDTNLNTFVHDSDPTPEGIIGQDMQLTVRIGYNGVNGLYNPNTRFASLEVVLQSAKPSDEGLVSPIFLFSIPS